MQSSIQYQPNSGSGGATAFSYDELGTLRRVQVTDGRSHTIAFETDIDGQIIRRDEEDWRAQGNPHEIWYRFNGRQLGYTGNNGTDDMTEAASIADRQVIAPTTPGAFRNGQLAGSSYADFAQSYDPLNSYGQGSGAGSYTVRGGESLQAIAQNLWGDAGLWYKLAEANGLSAGSALPEGMTLRLPAGVVRTTHNANTLTPYDPAEAIGDVSPTSPQPNKPKKNKCGVFGQILLVVIAVAVTAWAGPASLANLTWINGAIAGIAGSVASQAVGLATGIQQKFDFKGVAIAAISGAISGGIGQAANTANKALEAGKAVSSFGKAAQFLSGGGFVGGAVRGVVTSALTQGIGVAIGLQSKFDFAGVAVGAVVGGVVSETNFGGFGGRLASGVAGALAGGAARSVLTGTSFGDNVLAALPDVIGSTIGELVGGAISGVGDKSPPSSDGERIMAQAAYDRAAAAYPRNAAFLVSPQDDSYVQTASDIVVTATRNAMDEAKGFFDRLWSGVKSAGDWLFHGSSRNGYQRDGLVMRISRAVDRLPDRIAAYNPIAAGLRGLGFNKSAAAVRGLAAAPSRMLIDTIGSVPGFVGRVGNGAYTLVTDPNQAMSNIATNVRGLGGIPQAVGDHVSGVGADLSSGDPARIQRGSQSLGVDAINIGTLAVPITKLTALRGGEIVAAEGVTGGSTYASRLAQTPVSNGFWSGLRGESTFVSTHPDVVPIMGSDGIAYANAYPDFFPVSAGQVEITNMTASRSLNFAQADKAYADLSGLSARDIKTWRQANGYTWHEVEDLRTMQLVPSPVNGKFGHIGGVGEINAGAIRH